MALQPLLQSTCELQLVRSTHGVITNARADHLDVMGPNRLDVATALAGTTPVAGKLFTAESRIDSLKVLQSAAVDRGSELQIITQNDSARITEDELAQFSYLEHAENVALALRVCESIGVDRGEALRGMWAATPDPGAMKVHTTDVASMPAFDSAEPSAPCVFHFVNGFAANDPESTEQLWETAFNRFPDSNRRVMVMNCRLDRPDRSETMGAAVGKWSAADQVIVIGTGTEIFMKAARKSGVNPARLISLGQVESPEEVAEVIACEEALCEAGVMIMGVGNVKDGGFALDNFFEEHGSWIPLRVVEAQRQLTSLPANSQHANSRQRQVAGAS
jgi:poly-gamma-glutamate synthase PgsB/CapB